MAASTKDFGRPAPRGFPSATLSTPKAWAAAASRVFRGPGLNKPRQQPSGREPADSQVNPLMAFGVEGTAAPVLAIKPARLRRIQYATAIGVAIGVVALSAAAGYFGTRWSAARAAVPAPPAAATLRLETRPDGAEVRVDGQPRGRTPVSLSLAPGTHEVTLGNGADERQLPVTLKPGAEVTQYVELPSVKAAPALGRISVVTDPPGARVRVDGQPRGVSPLTISDLTASDHRVSVASDTGSAERSVTLEPGATVSVVFSLPKAAAPSAGWVTVQAPFDVQIRENDSVVATGRNARIMLPAGVHALTLANEALQYEESRRIDIDGGKTTALRIEAPRVAISINARPWADVQIDGASLGQTPIANAAVAIGTHDVVFRHPQLGERRQTIVVTARGPNRVTVDLTK